MSGSPLNNRKLADSLRAKLLKKANEIMDGDDEEAKKELLMKMSTNLLPRINEHTGENGDAIKVQQTLVKFLDDKPDNSGNPK